MVGFGGAHRGLMTGGVGQELPAGDDCCEALRRARRASREPFDWKASCLCYVTS